MSVLLLFLVRLDPMWNLGISMLKSMEHFPKLFEIFNYANIKLEAQKKHGRVEQMSSRVL